MLLYKDIISGDELFSDAFPIKEIDDVAFEVDCKLIQIKEGDVDIGANPSAEEADEGTNEEVKTVNNVVNAFRLQESSFDKKAYMVYIKGYMKLLKTKLQETKPDRVAPFEAGATRLVKKILENFKDYEFFIGENMEPEAMVALLNYREDGITPYFTFFKDGVIQEKV